MSALAFGPRDDVHPGRCRTAPPRSRCSNAARKGAIVRGDAIMARGIMARGR